MFWIAFILLLLVIFLFSRSNIERVLENTGLVEFINERFGDSGEADDSSEGPASDTGEERPGEERPGEETTPEAPGAGRRTEPLAADNTMDTEGEPDGSQPVEIVLETEVEENTLPSAESDDAGTTDPEPEIAQPSASGSTNTRSSEKPNVRNATVYLIRVTDDGKINTEGVRRQVYFDASPMTDTISSLLAGPNRDELNAGLLNLVPNGTRLLSASVRNGVANLNFSEEFRFNPMGVEGLVAQLKQIVYTTTEFSTVDAVQFYIEGETVTYLGSEGLRVDRPLSRDAF